MYVWLTRISGGGEDLRELATLEIRRSEAPVPPPGGRIVARQLLDQEKPICFSQQQDQSFRIMTRPVAM